MLTQEDINQIARIHKEELSGFLPELGLPFLRKFYRASLELPIIFTIVEKKNGQILGFVTGIETAKGLYFKIISQDIIGFGILFFKFFISHPGQLLKFINILTYPGFSTNTPELLTIAVSKKHQGRGVGKSLFCALREEFKNRKINKFKISVYDKLPAVGFYKKIGCKQVKTFDFLGEKMSYFSFGT